jgi:hypothetical protein
MQEAADDLAADGNEPPGLVGLFWERPFNPQRWAHWSGSLDLATIDASDVSGNPLGQSSGLALADSLTPTDPFREVGVSSANSSGVRSTDLAALSAGSPAAGGDRSPVPEPSTLLLVLLAISCGVGQRIALRRRARSAEICPT